MNTKVVPNPEQKGWEEDGTTAGGTPIYKWEAGGVSGNGSGGGLWEANGDDIYYEGGHVTVKDETNGDLRLGEVNNVPGLYSGDGKGMVFRSDVTNDANLFTWKSGSVERVVLDSTGNVGIGVTPIQSTFDLSAKEQLAEWKTKAKKASWPVVTDGAFEQEPTEDLVAEWMETRADFGKLQVAGSAVFEGSATCGSIDQLSGERGSKLQAGGTILAYREFGEVSVFRGFGDGVITTRIQSNGNAEFTGDVKCTGTVNSKNLVSEPVAYSSNQDGSYLLVEAPTNGGAEGFIFDHRLVSDAGGIASIVINSTGGNEIYRLSRTGNAEFAGSVSAGTLTTNREANGYFFRAYYGSTGTFSSFNHSAGNTLEIVPLGGLCKVNGNGKITGTLTVGPDNRPVSTKLDLITTLSTLRNATKDETTLEGLRDSIGNAIGGLIEKYEAEIAETMKTDE